MLLRIDWFDVEAQYNVYAPPPRKLSVMRIGPAGGLAIGRMIADVDVTTVAGQVADTAEQRVVADDTLAAQQDWMPSP